ncbi:MAG: hypothetical protein R3Y62_07180 [Eubacteriales bacterium]
MKKIHIFLLFVLILTVFTGCATKETETISTVPPVAEAPEVVPEVEAPEVVPEVEMPVLKDATLYIGMEDRFQEVAVQYEGDLSPEWLINQIAQETGWDLTLSQPVITGKSGFSVGFSSTCAMFVGPPDPQNPDYVVYDVNSMVSMVLDSVQKTLQQNFVDGELGNPDDLDIYYFLDGDQPLEVPDAGVYLSLDVPYGKVETTAPQIAMAFLGYSAEDYGSVLEDTLGGESYEAFAYDGDENYLLWVPNGLILVYEYDALNGIIGNQLYQTQVDAKLHLTCNVSDIMSNVVVVAEVDGEVSIWYPCISLKDGTLNMGDVGYPYGS